MISTILILALIRAVRTDQLSDLTKLVEEYDQEQVGLTGKECNQV